VATITGQRSRSTLPSADTPDCQGKQSGSPDSLSRTAAEATWCAVTASIAGTPHVRISKDGGRTYPARYARPLPADPPGQPCAVPVYDPASATGRMLALDLDPGRGDRDVHGAAVEHHRERGGAEVDHQAAELVQLLERLGARYIADVSPSGGRHVLVPFSSALPWRELRDLVRAMSLRFPVIDPAPMSSVSAQISPPGARHKSGGWRLLSMPLSEARAAVEHPNGPEMWAELLTEFAAELQQVEGSVRRAGTSEESGSTAELDDTGAPWVPRRGGRAPLGAELERVARSGRWDRSRYAGRSEARMAILGSLAARGWRLAEV
jgi:hypothetical protein